MNEAKISLERDKSKLIVVASDVSNKSQKEIKFSSAQKNVSVLIFNDISIESLSKAVGRKCGIISVNDNGFADSIGGYANDQ